MAGKTARKGEYSQRVPLKEEFAYAPSGVVVATVEWRRIGGRITPFVYAPSAEVAKRLPTPGSGMGARIKALREAGVLFPALEVYRRITHCYRIDDRRRGRGHSYLIWPHRRAAEEGPAFQSGLVYHFQEKSETPPYGTAHAVLALCGDPNALHINSKRAVNDLKANATDVGDRVTVWDLAAIYRDRS